MGHGQPVEGGHTKRTRRHGWFAAVSVLTLLAYARSFGSLFQFDDYNFIVGNEAIRVPSLDAFVHFGQSRLLPFATLALNYRIGGEDPFGYHVVNFAMHLLATWTVYALALALCQTPRLRGSWLAERPLPFAVGAAFLFACHPIQVQAVTYIVQRMATMAAMFYVGSVLLSVRARNAQLGLAAGRPTIAFGGSVLLALAAFFSKENSASLPVAILLTDWTFYGRQMDARQVLRLAPFFALDLVIPLTWKLLGTAPIPVTQSDGSVAGQVNSLLHLLAFRADPFGHIAPVDYFLTQCVVIPRYLRLVVLPWGFNVDHDIPVATGLSLPVVAGLASLAGLLAFGLYAGKRWSVVGFSVVWVFLALSVESSFFPISDVMVEHRMYLAMPGVALVTGATFAWAVRQWQRPALLLGAAAMMLLATLTFSRNEVWRTPLSLWLDALVKSPGKARVYVNVGTALHFEERLDEAITYYCKALAIDPQNKRAQVNLNRALEERVARGAATGDVLLEALEVGDDGSLTLTPPHPCPAEK
jgi:hypothetical protein